MVLMELVYNVACAKRNLHYTRNHNVGIRAVGSSGRSPPALHGSAMLKDRWPHGLHYRGRGDGLGRGGGGPYQVFMLGPRVIIGWALH